MKTHINKKIDVAITTIKITISLISFVASISLLKIPKWNAKGNAAIIIPLIMITKVIEFTELRIVEIGTNPPLDNVANERETESSIFTLPRKIINIAIIAVYIAKIILIVASNCLNLQIPPPNRCLIPANFVSG